MYFAALFDSIVRPRLQVYMATLTLEWSWPAFLVAVYVIGATANHSLFLAIHEISHNLAFRDAEHNKMLAIFANMPIGIPFCTMFKPFHILHHRYQVCSAPRLALTREKSEQQRERIVRAQGTEGVDTDIPSNLEAWLITSTSTCAADHSARKLIFVCFHSFAYALRPICLKPHLVVYDRWLAANWFAQLTFNAMFWYAHGSKSLLYFLLSTLIAGSLHPMAGHFIAEHYVTSTPAETYSYYGPLNYLAYNVGYHNEHHDFPNIPWSNLPRVRAIAPEFYDNIPQCHSWPGTLARFITRDAFSPFSRMQRVPASKDS